MVSRQSFIFGTFLLLLALLVVPTPVRAATAACSADITGDGFVDLSDFSQLVNSFLKSPIPYPRADISGDGIVDIGDYSLLVRSFLQTCTATPAPTGSPIPPPPPNPTSGDWSQFGGNAALTHYSPVIPSTPWKYQWQWNGAGSDGKQQSGHLQIPEAVQPITGGGRVYMVGGNQVFALNKTNGSVLWTRNSIGTLLATPVYANESLYVPSQNGSVYKLNAATGATVATFSPGGSFTTSLSIANGTLLAGNSNGNLYALNPSTMAQTWSYAAGSPIVTQTAYSQSKNLYIVNSQDLYVHALNAGTGTRTWRVKPTSRTYQAGNPGATGAQFEEGWPVIAEQHGIVFIRYRLDWDTLWTWNPFPTTNQQIRANLTSRPDVQALFALNLSNGSVAFVPNAGNGGQGDGGTLPMGPQPIIRTVGGKEVAYIIWRNAQTCAGGWCDGREDATMGEMVLDSTTVPGYSAGDVRFVRNPDIQTDEMMNIAMGGDTIFHSHWLINSAVKITDRSDALGATFSNPIKTVDAPFVIWRQVFCPSTNSQCNPQIFPGGNGTSYGPSNCPFNAATRYCSAGLYSYGDQRAYPAGFYEYHNDENSGTTPYTSITADLVLVKTIDGGLIALGSGNPLADAGSALAAQSPKASDVLGATTAAPAMISPYQAKKYIGEQVVVTGKIVSVSNHRPKAMYLSFSTDHSDSLLVRVFEKDLNKFGYDLATLEGKKVELNGFVTLYWPYVKDPEIIVTSPEQIRLLDEK